MSTQVYPCLPRCAPCLLQFHMENKLNIVHLLGLCLFPTSVLVHEYSILSKMLSLLPLHHKLLGNSFVYAVGAGASKLVTHQAGGRPGNVKRSLGWEQLQTVEVGRVKGSLKQRYRMSRPGTWEGRESVGVGAEAGSAGSRGIKIKIRKVHHINHHHPPSPTDLICGKGWKRGSHLGSRN